ncbi:MAG: hypothetical protein LBR75_03010 [Prevotellaceae bacterium]|jgi:hypothetical protein|nr:hypothetical protein [Prevotellaceae bacterium]
MLGKIQQYLLIHYPLLWNLKIVPVLLVSLVLNVVFYAFGYFFTMVDFTRSYYHNSNIFDQPFTLFGVTLSIITVLILWLIFYSKNNAFRVFYPKKTAVLFAEWLLVWVIVFGLFVIPFSFQCGVNAKIKTYATKEEAVEARKLLNMIDYLTPNGFDDHRCFQEYPAGYKENENGAVVLTRWDSIGDSLIYTNKRLRWSDFPNFVKRSLLHQDTTTCVQIGEDSCFAGGKIVRQWLVDENRAAVASLMDSFIVLAEKHNLPTNLTREKWLQLIYTPPSYEVNDFNIIRDYIPARDDEHHSYYDDVVETIAVDEVSEGRTKKVEHFIPHNELDSAYNTVYDAWHDKEMFPVFMLVTVILSGLASLLVFSFRCTKGKTWLIAFVAAIILMFVSIISAVIADETFDMRGDNSLYIFFAFWLIVFAWGLYYVIRLNKNRQRKRFSAVIINLLVWLLPFVPVLLFAFFLFYIDSKCHFYSNESNYYSHPYYIYYDGIRDFIEDNALSLLWANVALTVGTMWLFIKTVLRKWKSLPEG